MKLELSVLAGPESKAFLVDFKKQIDRLESLTKGKGLSHADVENGGEADADVETSEETEDEFETKPKKGAKKAAAFDEEEAEEAAPAEETEETEEDEDFAAPKKGAKAAKPAKVTMDDVNDACKARAKAAGKGGRDVVLGILKKKFKTETISSIKPEQWPAVIAAMKA